MPDPLGPVFPFTRGLIVVHPHAVISGFHCLIGGCQAGRIGRMKTRRSPSSAPVRHAAKTLPAVLVFAASDPSCGAGIQADILTLASLGCHPLTVMTALTVQDTLGIESVYPVDAEVVEAQARALLEDMPVAAFKVGALGSVENVIAVARIVADYPDIPLVVDPVLASGRGDTLASEAMLRAICDLLLPQTLVMTPNTLEAERLVNAGEEDGDEDDMSHAHGDKRGSLCPDEPLSLSQEESCDRLAALLLLTGADHVLITGTHAPTTQVYNRLYDATGLVQNLSWPRLPGSYHGSGCTLASALAAGLAHGLPVAQAASEAQEYAWQTLNHAYRPGMGQWIPDRLFWARDDAEKGDSSLADMPSHPEEQHGPEQTGAACVG